MAELFSWLKGIVLTILIIGLLSASAFFLLNHFCYLRKPIAENMDASVCIETKDSSGSGVVFRNRDKVFVWTCHHVVQYALPQQLNFNLLDKTFKYSFESKWVNVKSKIFNDNMDEAGYVNVYGKVIRFSEADDLALIEVVSAKPFNRSVHFPSNTNYAPSMGTRVFHIGSMLGFFGNGGCSDGIAGHQGINMDNKCYDKVSLSFHFGSSGGGVFESSSGHCIGLIARSHDRTSMHQGYIVPYRRMVDFANRLDCMWAVDASLQVPADYKDKISDDALNLDIERFLKAIRRIN